MPKYFCKNNGTENYFLFMEHYDFGSILNYIPKSLNEIISILNQVIASATLAFEHFGFIHGDLHPGNILLNTLSSIIQILNESPHFSIMLLIVKYKYG